jgi:hypothetical protein
MTGGVIFSPKSLEMHTSRSLVLMSSSETTIPSPKRPAFLLMQELELY